LRRLQPYSMCHQVREQRQAERGRQREAMQLRQEQARGKQQLELQVRGVLNRVLTQVERGAERDAKGTAREVSALLGVMVRQVPWRAGLHTAPYSTSYDAFGGGRAAPTCGPVCIMGAVQGVRGCTVLYAALGVHYSGCDHLCVSRQVESHVTHGLPLGETIGILTHGRHGTVLPRDVTTSLAYRRSDATAEEISDSAIDVLAQHIISLGGTAEMVAGCAPTLPTDL